jgi:hypothetical protein
VSAPVETIIEIPPEWTQAVHSLWEIGDSENIAAAQWDEIVKWLVSTTFDDRSFAAGEAAAVLIRDQAPPEVRARIWEHAQTADEWLLHFCVIALEKDRDTRYRELLRRAAQSSCLVARISAQAMQRSLPDTGVGPRSSAR